MEWPWFDTFDADGDGDMDVAVEFGGSITWHENLDGHGSFGPLQHIEHQFGQLGEGGLHLVDVDGDADDDLIVGARGRLGERLLWIENENSGFGAAHLILNLFGDDLLGSFPTATSADIGGDNDADITPRPPRVLRTLIGMMAISDSSG